MRFPNKFSILGTKQYAAYNEDWCIQSIANCIKYQDEFNKRETGPTDAAKH